MVAVTYHSGTDWGGLGLILLISGVIFAIVIPIGLKMGKQMRADGLIANRLYSYHEMVHTYTSPIITYNALLDRIMHSDNLPNGLHYETVPGKAILKFEKKDVYKAQLAGLHDDSGNRFLRFSFTQYYTRKGSPLGSTTIAMNELLTAIEKEMLAIDPLVVLSLRYGQRHTK